MHTTKKRKEHKKHKRHKQDFWAPRRGAAKLAGGKREARNPRSQRHGDSPHPGRGGEIARFTAPGSLASLAYPGLISHHPFGVKNSQMANLGSFTPFGCGAAALGL